VEHTSPGSHDSYSQQTNDRTENVGGDVDNAGCVLVVFSCGSTDSAALHHS